MPLRALRPVAPKDDERLPPLSAHPEYARLAALDSALTAAIEERHRSLRIDELERAGKVLEGKGGRARALCESLAVLKAEQRANAAPQAPAEWPDTSSAAAKLLAGHPVPRAEDRATMRERLHGEIKVLGDALRETGRRMEEIRSAASAEAALQLREEHRAVLRSILDAGVGLAAAVEAERAIQVRLVDAGYAFQFHILPRPCLPGAAALGSAHEWSSQISQYRRLLESQGAL